ncbi:unnamed protein product [Euphydryas editha]|uniref:Uncharacterized protein n=1 Tax=Euphydryas editha TaxID=104508 RepID=A0AAU9TNI0_EUPED|nr:unnamed protein product [Euphydryas editha]
MGALAVEGHPEIEEQGLNRSSQSITAVSILPETANEDEPPSPPNLLMTNISEAYTRSDQDLPSTSHEQVLPSTSREQVLPTTSREQVLLAGSTLPIIPLSTPTTPTRPRSIKRLQPTVPSPHSPGNSPRRFNARARRRRAQTPLDRATSEFVAIEQRRLQLEEMRERDNSRRIDAEIERNRVFSQFANIAETWLQHYLARDNTEILNNDN